LSRKCPACHIENEDSEYFCGYCGTILLNDRAQIEIKKRPNWDGKEKTNEVTNFLLKNSPLFTILGVFGALSFYLVSLSSAKTNIIVNIVVNSTTLKSIFNSTISSNDVLLLSNATITNNLDKIQPITGIDSIISINLGLACSFSIFFIILSSLLSEAMKMRSDFKWVFSVLFSFLAITIIIYLINTYFSIIYALFTVAITIGIVTLYFKEYSSILDHFTFEIDPIKWIIFFLAILILSIIIAVELFFIFTNKLMMVWIFSIFGDYFILVVYCVPMIITGIISGIVLLPCLLILSFLSEKFHLQEFEKKSP